MEQESRSVEPISRDFSSMQSFSKNRMPRENGFSISKATFFITIRSRAPTCKRLWSRSRFTNTQFASRAVRKIRSSILRQKAFASWVIRPLPLTPVPTPVPSLERLGDSPWRRGVRGGHAELKTPSSSAGSMPSAAMSYSSTITIETLKSQAASLRKPATARCAFVGDL